MRDTRRAISTSGILKGGWGIPAHHPPRSPAPNIVIGGSGILTRGWRLRLRAPLPCLLLISSPFCPSSVFRESLGLSLFPERPFCPSHPGLPCCPGIVGLRAGANSHRPSSGEGWMDCSLHHPSRGSSRRTRGSPGAPPPSSGRPRRGGAAPAFVGAPNSSPSAPRAFALGTGKPQPPVLAARSPMRPVV